MIQAVFLQNGAFQREEATAPELEDPFAGLLGEHAPREELWLGKPFPRYTSYPPATAFQEGFSAEDYQAELSSLPAQDSASLYLHIPFCRSLCRYCGCHTTPTNCHEKITDYLESLQREIGRLSEVFSRQRRVTRVHFGGGSPNVLSEKEFGATMGVLAKAFDFSSCREIAVELDPRLVTSAQAKALRLAGVTRVSLGVQDFDPEVQKAIGREQPYDLVEKAVGLLRENGVTSVNFDLMYGLPLQSSVGMLRTARLAAALCPDRVSLFSYAHMPRLKKHQQSLEAYGLPSPRVALSLERAARKALVEEGYAEIGMDHFALPEDSLAKAAETGALHRSFQGYTDDDSSLLLGLGASAIGRSSRHYFQNIKDTVSYRRAVSEKGLAVAKGLRLSREDVFRGAIIETLMCFMSVNLESLCRQHDFSLSSLSAEMEALVPYEKAGVVRREGWTLSLAIPQRMAIRAVAAVFDTTLASATTYASKTV